MATQPNPALEAMVALVEQKARELSDLKRVTNVMCRDLKVPEIFAEVEETVGGGIRRVKPDQFYGKSPIVASREYLEFKHEAVRTEEILEALTRGGFDFEAQNWPEKDRLRLLALSLSKNSIIFHKLPQGTYGLLKWYPDREKDKGEGRPTQKPQTKAQSKARPKSQKATGKAAARQQQKPDSASAGGEVVAVQEAISEMSGPFTLDDVLPMLEENYRDRTKIGAELNRLAQKGTGIRKVTKGALNKPAVYERTDKEAGMAGA
jgi:hypothetical protein